MLEEVLGEGLKTASCWMQSLRRAASRRPISGKSAKRSRKPRNTKVQARNTISLSPLPGLRIFWPRRLQISKMVPGIRPCAFGHVGDGNIHFNLSRPADMSDGDFRAMEPEIHKAVYDRTVSMGGSISAEHGIGRLRRGELDTYKSPVALDVMRSIKATLDPNGIMNPGKVL